MGLYQSKKLKIKMRKIQNHFLADTKKALKRAVFIATN